MVLVTLFLMSWAGQFWTGLLSHNEDLTRHRARPVSALEYLSSGHFLESTFENWESEFLQMAVFVWLTAKLYQRGSAESSPLPDERPKKRNPPKRYFKDAPLVRALYENSLSLALLSLFFISFIGHLYGGWKEENLKRALTQDAPVSLNEFVISSDFWFQSFQNWQSEFLSIGVVVVLTIFLRQKGSAQSKEVDDPHWKTKE